MRKSLNLVIAVILLLALALTGCSSGKMSVGDGVAAMQKELVTFKTAVTKNDGAAAKKSAAELDEIWEKFEEAVKAQSKSLYQDIEEPLLALKAGTKDGKVDAKVLTEQAVKLESLLATVKK